jgi:hypothetical protein
MNNSSDAVVKALWGIFTTPNESDSNGEVPGPTDGLYAIARAIHRLAAAVERFNPEEPPPPVKWSVEWDKDK